MFSSLLFIINYNKYDGKVKRSGGFRVLGCQFKHICFLIEHFNRNVRYITSHVWYYDFTTKITYTYLLLIKVLKKKVKRPRARRYPGFHICFLIEQFYQNVCHIKSHGRYYFTRKITYKYLL